jgi:hypothetical protein
MAARQPTALTPRGARGYAGLGLGETTADTASSVRLDVTLFAKHGEERDEPPKVYVDRVGEFVHTDPPARRELANDAVTQFEGLDVGRAGEGSYGDGDGCRTGAFGWVSGGRTRAAAE